MNLSVSRSSVGVKICGVTCSEDALMCAGLGVDFIGLNFYPRSSRYIEPARAVELVRALPAGVSTVGVFVDRLPDEVAEIAERVGLSAVQLHGQEPASDLPALTRFWLIRAFRLGCAADWNSVIEHIDSARRLGRGPDSVLIDAYVEGQQGGTGETVTPEVLVSIPRVPRLILAGGLTPQNVAGRVAHVQPWAVDVASGVESSPGRKDPAKVAAFVAAARNVPREAPSWSS